MPYIKQDKRTQYDTFLNGIKNIPTKGELEYCIFKLLIKFIQNKEKNYTNLHDCVYAATHCADEFRRRFLDERENFAREQNGDITA